MPLMLFMSDEAWAFSGVTSGLNILYHAAAVSNCSSFSRAATSYLSSLNPGCTDPVSPSRLILYVSDGTQC